MKNTVRLLQSLFLVAIATATYGQTTDNSLLSHIPTDADQVYHINVGALSSKVNWPSLLTLFKDKGPGKDPKMAKFMGIFTAGIDLQKDIIVSKSNSLEADSLQYTTILLHLTDSAKFIAWVRSSEAHFHLLHLPGKERVGVAPTEGVSWNDHLAVFTIPPKSKTKTPSATPGKTEAAVARSEAATGRRSAAALRGYPTSFFATDAQFKAGLADDADLAVWNKLGSGYAMIKKILEKTPAGGQLNGLNAMMQNSPHSQTLMTLRFEQGKLVFESRKMLSPAENAKLVLFKSTPFSNDLTAQLPSGKLLGMAAIHFNMAGLRDSLQKNADKLAPMLKGKDLKPQDIFDAIKGEFLLLAYARDSAMPGGPGGAKMPLIYGVLSIGDQTAFQKVATALKLNDANAPGIDSTTAADTAHKMHLFYSVQNKIAVIGFSSQQVKNYFLHPGSGSASRLLSDRARATPFSFGIDVQTGADYLSQIMMKGDTLSAKDQQVIAIIRRFDTISLAAGNINDGQIESYFEIKMTDANTNALTTIINIAAGK